MKRLKLSTVELIIELISVITTAVTVVLGNNHKQNKPPGSDDHVE